MLPSRKGEASYVTIVTKSRRSERAGWPYENPTSAFRSIAGYLAFCASRIDEAKVGDEVVLGQPGDFWGLDHVIGRRTLQGRPGNNGVVTAADPTLWSFLTGGLAIIDGGSR